MQAKDHLDVDFRVDPCNHQPHGPFRIMLGQANDTLVEVGVGQAGHGHEKLPFQGLPGLVHAENRSLFVTIHRFTGSAFTGRR